MTTADADLVVAPTAAAGLRTRVRRLLEDEYLRLSCLDRRPLAAMGTATVDDGIDPAAVAEEITVLDARIARLHEHLTALAAHPGGPARGRVVLLDCGDGAQLMLVSPIALIDEQVIAEDSPLGSALRNAVPGRVVAYATPGGSGRARVLAVEGKPAPARIRANGKPAETTQWFGLGPAEVLVGFDGTPSSRSAVAWAAREAALQARPQRVLHARQDGAPSNVQHDWIRATACNGAAAARIAEGEMAPRATVVVPPGPV